MSRRKHIIGFGLLVAAATTLPAYAQPAQLPTAPSMANDFPVCTKKATDSDQDLAKQKFIAARQDYEEGNYDTAIKRFKTAYDLDCSKPELLLVISSAFEKKGDKQAALAALEVYTQRAPKDSPDMPTTQLKIENLKKQMASAPPTASSSAPPAGGGSGAGENQEHTIFPWLVVGVGGAALVTGVVLAVTAPDYPVNCNPDIGDGKCTRDPPLSANAPDSEKATSDAKLKADTEEAGRVRTYRTAGPVLMVVGGALVVGGLVWHFLEPTGPKSASGRRRLTPAVAPGFAGLSYGGTF